MSNGPGGDEPQSRRPGRRIGLLGGSFNPAHQGHREISLQALARLGPDEVWWLVSPQNPLKPGVRFVWIMGADSLASFHRWQAWRRIAATYPIAVVDRPGATLALLSSPMAKTFAPMRLAEENAAALPFCDAPAWVFLHGPRSPTSSSALRDRGAAS